MHAQEVMKDLRLCMWPVLTTAWLWHSFSCTTAPIHKPKIIMDAPLIAWLLEIPKGPGVKLAYLLKKDMRCNLVIAGSYNEYYLKAHENNVGSFVAFLLVMLWL